MKKLLLTSAALLTMTASYSVADEYSMDADRLTGPYIGVYGGYGWTDLEGEDSFAGVDADLNGADYGLFIGMKADTLLDATINRLGLSLTGALELQYGWSSQDDTVGLAEF